MEGATFLTVFPLPAISIALAITLSTSSLINRPARIERGARVVDGLIVEGSAAELSVAKKDAPFSLGMLITCKRLVTIVVSSGMADRIESCFMVAGRVVDRGMVGAIRDPAVALGEKWA